MTVKEFYEYCKAARIEDYEIDSSKISKAGCYIGEREVKPGCFFVDHDKKEIHV